MVGYQLENCQINYTECTYVWKLILSTETQHERHDIGLISFLWCYARWHHWNCSYTQLEAATFNHLHSPITLYSAVLVSKFTKSGMKVQISLDSWGNDRVSLSSVLPQTWTQASRLKDKSPSARPPLSLYLLEDDHMNALTDIIIIIKLLV